MSDHYGEIMWIVFVWGYFMRLQDEWNIPTKNNEHDLHVVITMNLFLFLYCTVDLILILMIYVYNFNEFIGETAIS